MADPPPSPSTSKRRRWYHWLVPRFSLRTLLIGVTLFAVVCGYWIERAERQRRVAEFLTEKGVQWQFSSGDPGGASSPVAIIQTASQTQSKYFAHYFRSITAFHSAEARADMKSDDTNPYQPPRDAAVVVSTGAQSRTRSASPRIVMALAAWPAAYAVGLGATIFLERPYIEYWFRDSLMLVLKCVLIVQLESLLIAAIASAGVCAVIKNTRVCFIVLSAILLLHALASAVLVTLRITAH